MYFLISKYAVQYLSKVIDQLDFDEVTKMKLRRSADVPPVGKVNSIDFIIRIVSYWVWLSNDGLPIIFKKQREYN